MFWTRKLPGCDELFMRFFDPWSSPADRESRGFQATRPDLIEVRSLVGASASEATTLGLPGEADREFDQVRAMVESARGDWPRYLPVREPMDLSWVQAFDDHYDRKRVRALVDQSRPDDFGNLYLVVACQFGAVLGTVMQQQLGRLQWMAGRPYWECALFDSPTGTVIPVFHWAVKKLSEYGLEDGMAAKIEACLKGLQQAAP